MGATATADMDALFNPATFEQMDGNASSGQQFKAELAYGFPVHNDRLTLTPAVAIGPLSHQQELRPAVVLGVLRGTTGG